MAINTSKMSTRGGDRNYDTSNIGGVREERGIVEGIVKANVHPTNMGVISVFIPRFSTEENDRSQWRQVKYCTPFYSRTDSINNGTDDLSVKQASGIVTPPPDLGTRVLCFFPDGRNAEGYYFACIPDTYIMQSIPETTYNRSGKAATEINDSSTGPTPSDKISNFKSVSRLENKLAQEQLTKQGLELDPVRGQSTSGYMRESPSEIIGISSKGRRVDTDGKDLLVKYKDQIKNPDTTNKEVLEKVLGPKYRRKGHSITLDDGDVNGNSNQVRLKTSTGHQILLNDTKGVIYVSNADGTVWLELNNTGTMDVYANDSINFRSKNINFHADGNIKMHSKGFTQVTSEAELHLEGTKATTLLSNESEVGITASDNVHLSSQASIYATSSGPSYYSGGAFISVSGSLVLLQGPKTPAKFAKPARLGVKRDTELKPSASNNTQTYQPVKPTKTSVDRLVTHEPFVAHGTLAKPEGYTGGLAGGGGKLGGALAIIGMAASAYGAASDAGMFDTTGDAFAGAGAIGSGGVSTGPTFVTDGAGGIVTSNGSGVISGLADSGVVENTASYSVGGLFDDISSGFDEFLDNTGLSDLGSSLSEWTSELTSGPGAIPDELTVEAFGGTDAGGIFDSGIISGITDLGKQVYNDFSSFPGEFSKIVSDGKGAYGEILANLEEQVPGSSQYLVQYTAPITQDLLGPVLDLPFVSAISSTDILKQQNNGFSVGKLDTENTKGLNVAVQKIAGSNGNSQYIDATTKAIGKYGASAYQLSSLGYVRQDAVFNDQLSSANMWTGKDGMNSINDFLANPHVQEVAQQALTVNNYQTLVNIGGIQPEDDAIYTMAMLTATATSTPEIALAVRAGQVIDGVVKNTTGLKDGNVKSQVELAMKEGAEAGRKTTQNTNLQGYVKGTTRNEQGGLVFQS